MNIYNGDIVIIRFAQNNYCILLSRFIKINYTINCLIVSMETCKMIGL